MTFDSYLTKIEFEYGVKPIHSETSTLAYCSEEGKLAIFAPMGNTVQKMLLSRSQSLALARELNQILDIGATWHWIFNGYKKDEEKYLCMYCGHEASVSRFIGNGKLPETCDGCKRTMRTGG